MQRVCHHCGVTFAIVDADLAFYDKVSPLIGGKKFVIPPPLLCPDCRQQQRLGWRNERKLYKRICNLCRKDIISIYASEQPFPVYCHKCWWSDRWDMFATGRDIDFSRPFLEQFEDVMKSAPLLALLSTNNENSDYVNLETDDKDCYMNFGGHFNQNCYYNTYALHCRNCVDNYWVFQCELLYDCVQCEHCYHSVSLAYSSTCSDCSFGYDLKGCRQCIGCTGLRQKERYLFNEPCTEEELQVWIRKLATNSGQEEVRKRFNELLLRFPRRFAFIEQSESCTGDNIAHAKNCRAVFESEKDQDNAHTAITFETHDMQDANSVAWSELIYYCVALKNANNVRFCAAFLNGFDSLYCFNVFDVGNLFGCVGLKDAKYCILNKQYTEQEYQNLVPKLIEHMQKTGEWGSFFPISLSPFGYDETVAQEYFPLNQKDALTRGYHWRGIIDEMPKVLKKIVAAELPDTIEEIPDDILHWALLSQETRRPFKLIKQELDFYRQMGLPVPRLHPDERRHRRMTLRNPRKLWSRQCSKCGEGIETSYDPKRPEIVYCEECYLKEVY